jgi:hypothetical protein
MPERSMASSKDSRKSKASSKPSRKNTGELKAQPENTGELEVQPNTIKEIHPKQVHQHPTVSISANAHQHTKP